MQLLILMITILQCETFLLREATTRRHFHHPNIMTMQRSLTERDSFIETAKQNLRKALIESNGSTASPKVLDSIEKLHKLNPTTHCASSSFLVGTFITLTAPNFPDNVGTDSKGNFQYTLGRLTFDLLHPNNLVCSIKNIYQPVRKMSHSPFQMSYAVNISLLSSVSDGSELHSILFNDGYCSPSSEDGNRLEVKFTECILSPDYSVHQDLTRWNKIFNDQAVTASGKATTHFASHMHINDSICVPIQRPPTGYLDILFLDHTMRVTRGNRNSIVVVERVDD